MQIETKDMIKKKLLDAQEEVRDYQKYSDKVDDGEIRDTFRQFAEDAAMQASKLQCLLARYEG